nr:hypothetical protein [Bacteroidota bacterium]
MNRYLSIVLIIVYSIVNAQSPESFKFQTVVRDSTGVILQQLPVELKICILKDGAIGDVVYSEMHSGSTNQFGLISLNIGQGEPVSGNFSQINWGDHSFFLQLEADLAGMGEFQYMGTSQILSVPYALYAKASGLKNVPSYPQEVIDTLAATTGMIVLNNTTQCLNYYTGLSWMEMCGACTPQPTLASAGNDQTLIGDQTMLEANVPVFGTGNWSILTGTGGVVAEPDNPSSIFTGIQGNHYELSWAISNNCGNNSDNVFIHFVNELPPASEGLLFAPYVDCLLWPNYDISDISGTGICLYTCAFIVDNEFEQGANPCWGGFATLGMDYYQDKITSLRDQGGEIIMSFGGANGVELAFAASDEYELRDAYKTVIDAYSLNSIDFDIEGFLVAEPISRERRSKAIKLLQNEYPFLKISLTLPVMPDGLTNDGRNTVQSALANEVDIDCVNIMAMDYGPSGIDMGEAAISAGEALFGQLQTLYTAAGIILPDSVIWSKIGICPMIGENDVPGEIFYLDDATDLAIWAAQKKIGRLSMWSANRDRQCDNPNDPLYSCSHIPQLPFEFSGIFGAVATNPCDEK